MLRILAPTDFSYNAHNALLVATKLARCYSAEIIYLHAMANPIVPATSPEEVYDSLYQTERTQVVQQLQNESRKVFEEAGLRPSELLKQVLVQPSPLIDTILEIGANNNVSLIVMGASGSNGLKRFLIGSNTLEMIRTTLVPLLVIPPDYSFQGFRVITVVLEPEQLLNRPGFNILLKFINSFSATVHFLFKIDPDDPIPDLKALLHSTKHLDGIENTNYQVRTLVKGTREKKLQEHLLNTSTDLLVRLPKKNVLWSETFFSTLSDETSDSAKIPLLIIPQVRP